MNGSGTADRVDQSAVSPGVSETGATHSRRVDPLTVTQRLQREGRWFGQVELVRDRMMREAKDAIPDKTQRQAWVYGELDRMYPPLGPGDSHTVSETSAASQGIRGLGDLPANWPELPSNASLSAEVGWVQANRLRVCSETGSGATVVDLGRALSPAPSWAALGWLETSIRSYAKFVDVAAKASASDDGEAEVWRHERMAIEEVRALMEEMMPDD